MCPSKAFIRTPDRGFEGNPYMPASASASSIVLLKLPRKYPDQQFFTFRVEMDDETYTHHMTHALELIEHPDANIWLTEKEHLHVTFAYGDCVVENWKEIETSLADSYVAHITKKNKNSMIVKKFWRQTPQLRWGSFDHPNGGSQDGSSVRVAMLNIVCHELALVFEELKKTQAVEDWCHWLYRKDGTPPFHITFACTTL